MKKFEAKSACKKVDDAMSLPANRARLMRKITGYGISRENNKYTLKFMAPADMWTMEALKTEFGLEETCDVEIEEMETPIIPFPEIEEKTTRPVKMGESISNNNNEGGTIGCIVKRKNEYYILSCNHVLALGKDSGTGDSIISPAFNDGGRMPDDIIGKLSKHYFRINYENVNFYDAALAVITSDRVRLSNVVPGLGNIKGTDDAKKHMRVAKYGKSSGLTYGQVTDIDYRMALIINGKHAFFKKQFLIKGDKKLFAKDGDSGSVIINTKTQKAVGLLCAVDSTGRYGIASRLKPVLSIFKAKIV